MDECFQIVVTEDDLSDGKVIQLLEQHRQEMLRHSPPEHVHALDVNQLRGPQMTFWSAWIYDGYIREFAGCGGLKDLGNGHAELKSMKTNQNHLRKGVAQALLTQIITSARDSMGVTRISLETGTQQVFRAARELYQRNGFEQCEPFGDYPDVDISVCMTKQLQD